jgi:peptidoglycan/xylan/chitin deacetylase (PgdA/CDA1 family)
MRIRFDLFPGGVNKALTLSYDDGRDFDRRMVDIMNRAGIRGTFHLNSGMLGKPGYLRPDEVAPLFAGHEVSVHTVSHPFLNMSPTERIADEILQDRRALEALVGYPVKGMSYPFGTWNDQVVNMLPALGIEYARTTASHGSFDMPADFLRWNPTCHHRDMLEYAEKLIEYRPRHSRMALLYVWGHSYEFDTHNNWEQFERFCERIGGRSDIWYATNAEIVAYMNALRALRFSVSGGIVHNPSAIPVWFSAEGRAVEVKPGETVTLGTG